MFFQLIPPDLCRQVISDALKAGYRCFDCAQFYENEVRRPVETGGNRWKPLETVGQLGT